MRLVFANHCRPDTPHVCARAGHRVTDGFSWNDYGQRAIQLYQMLTNPKPVC